MVAAKPPHQGYELSPNNHSLQIKSLQANLQSLSRAAAGVKDRDEQDKIMQLLSEATATIAGVGPGGDL